MTAGRSDGTWWRGLMAAAVLASPALAQKSVYWPAQFNEYPEVTLARSAQSDNFVVFWGQLAGPDPTQAPPAIDFDPAAVLAELESVYATYITQVGFLDDTVGNLAAYKIIVVMNDTWSSGPWTGWAFGASYDNTIGAMWVHPDATPGPSWVLAHELAHTLQNQVFIDNPGHGLVNFEPTGSFWETHAQFMAGLHHPTLLESVDLIRFFNTQHFFFASTRHHYGNTLFLHHLRDEYGLDFINRIWREANAGTEDAPLAIMRIMGWTQEDLNDCFGMAAARNVVFDYT
ncbi:MAG: hypothetical protein KDA21_03770, partial [Phycisphaerales bacterium]|nr:hypothetical protein [Phycisphaerales bacterium]